MDMIPWFGWIVLAGIASFTLTEIVSTLLGRRRKDSASLADALRANSDAQVRTSERLDAIENRLSTIEKTLNDIP